MIFSPATFLQLLIHFYPTEEKEDFLLLLPEPDLVLATTPLNLLIQPILISSKLSARKNYLCPLAVTLQTIFLKCLEPTTMQPYKVSVLCLVMSIMLLQLRWSFIMEIDSWVLSKYLT